MAFCSFSKARTSIWRTRSRDTPYSCDSSSSVAGLSFRRRSVRMCCSRSFKVASAVSSRPIRISYSSSLASFDSGLTAFSSTSQSCHSPPPSASLPMGAFKEASPPDMRRFMEMTSSLVTPSLVAICSTCSGRKSPSSTASIWPLILRRLKKSFFCAAVVPIFTRLHERRMYSWIDARIHHIA